MVGTHTQAENSSIQIADNLAFKAHICIHREFQEHIYIKEQSKDSKSGTSENGVKIASRQIGSNQRSDVTEMQPD